MANSRYNNFSKVRSNNSDYYRLETFPSIKTEDLEEIPHNVVMWKETDRMDAMAETFYGGPAGGLAAGFKNVKEINYAAASLDAADISQSEAAIGERYIPTHGGIQGERGYLNHVDETNTATTHADLIPLAGPIDSETGTRSESDLFQ